MPSPKEEPIITETVNSNESEFLSFLENPVQEFDAPELPKEEQDQEPDIFSFEEESEIKKPLGKIESNKMALRYVKLFDKGFSHFAAVYSSGQTTDYQIDDDDAADLADPLAELIATNKILDLPPGWALAITALIIYAPLTMKAIGQRKDNKVLETKKNESVVEAETEEEHTD